MLDEDRERKNEYMRNYYYKRQVAEPFNQSC